MKKFILILLATVFLSFMATAVLADENINTTTAAPSTTANNHLVARTKQAVSQVDLACMQKAVNVRDSAILVAFDKKYQAVRNALETRKSTLIADWHISVLKDRLTAITAVHKNFRASRVAANKAYTQEVKSAWEAFKVDSKTCHNANTVVESIGTDLSL
jgi:hypothetical protein